MRDKFSRPKYAECFKKSRLTMLSSGMLNKQKHVTQWLERETHKLRVGSTNSAAVSL